MNEDDISKEMYLAADAESEIAVLSWQGVGGKSYLTRDVRIRVGRKTMAPDLVVLVQQSSLWLIEIKGSHAESLAEDEPKLLGLQAELGDEEILDQVARRARVTLPTDCEVVLAVAYSTGRPGADCSPSIRHLAWEDDRGVNPMLRSL
jgi:hypothetical protein